ncbi:FtsX-like permease family protein [Paenibacillus sp. 1001270B_150601_E10]|uniref:FtsX-like permease family protein n=1 Tax=Paenibacillus sp. 1001270B_150601_E10 TaxID=2787079 RepID=UPI00189E5870|nr:ABC transporter permease [Paenibacillus sp. 1001270B_150601_E10]
MTFRRLAIKNIIESWQRYSAYFLSCMFSVMISFLYSSFTHHPDVIGEKIPSGSSLSVMLYACEVLIMTFAVMFTLYSSKSFVHSRRKEFGLLTLFGMTKWQIRRMMIYEQMAIAILAVASGIATGALFLKLFLMGMSKLLGAEAPMAFHFSKDALLSTVYGYSLLFFIVAIISIRVIGKSSIIELLKPRREQRSAPAFMWVFALIGVGCIVWGYMLAYHANLMSVFIVFFPTVLLTSVGTFFLYSHTSFALLNSVKHIKSLYYKGKTMLHVTRAIHRLRENAGVLFAITMLCAFVLSATSTFFSFNRGYQHSAMLSNPFDLIMWTRGQEEVPVSIDEIKKTAKEYGHEVTTLIESEIVEGDLITDDKYGHSVTLIGIDHYNQLAQALNKKLLASPKEGEAYWIDQSLYNKYDFLSNEEKRKLQESKHQVKVSEEGEAFFFTIKGRARQLLLSQEITAPLLLVISNEEMTRIQHAAHGDRKLNLYNFEWDDNSRSLPLIEKIEQKAGDKDYYIRSRVRELSDVEYVTSLAIVVSMMMSTLFYIACGSILTFKIMTDQQRDVKYYTSLLHIGLSMKEVRRVISVQVGIFFFLPCIIASIHTIFAMKTLSNLLFTNIIGYSMYVIFVYVLVQFVYFIAVRESYLHKIRKQFVE